MMKWRDRRIARRRDIRPSRCGCPVVCWCNIPEAVFVPSAGEQEEGQDWGNLI